MVEGNDPYSPLAIHLAWMEATFGDQIWLPNLPPPGRAIVEGNDLSLAIHLVWMEAPFGDRNWLPNRPPPGRAKVEGKV